MQNKVVIGAILSLLLASVCAITVNINAVQAPPPLPYLPYLLPVDFSLTSSKPTVKVDETFDIIVNVGGINLSWQTTGLDFAIIFPTAQFELLQISEGPFMKQFPTPPNTPENGTLLIAPSPPFEYSTPFPYPPPNIGVLLQPNSTGQWSAFAEGNGTLATLTFKALEPGTSNFQLTDTHLSSLQIPLAWPDHFLNDLSITVLPQLHDVAVVSLEPSTTETYPEHTVDLTIVTQNRGETPETFNVSTYYDIIPIGTQTVSELAPGANQTLTFHWNTDGLTLYTDYTLSAQASTVPYEANTTNNVLVDGTVRIKMLGDVNNDQKVDIKDLAQAARSFGTYLNGPNWNPNADIYQDSRIDIRDLVTIARNFGKTYP